MQGIIPSRRLHAFPLMDHQLAINLGIIQNSKLKGAFVTYKVKTNIYIYIYIMEEN
jgi:hypothetical protein